MACLEVNAEEYSIENDQAVIEQVNEVCDSNYAIINEEAFRANICNKITPEEFETMLTQNRACTVSYVGNWVIPQSGLMDLTIVTYNITYYPD